MPLAYILFAHGARDPAWARPFEAVAAELRRLSPGREVRLAFLEFMQPDLPAAADAVVAAGAAEVAVVPLFLGAGGHVRKDLPAMLGAVADRYPQVRWRLAPAIGESAAVVGAMAAAAIDLAEAGAVVQAGSGLGTEAAS